MSFKQGYFYGANNNLVYYSSDMSSIFSDEDNVSYVKKCLRAIYPRYMRIKDCLSGSDAVKSKRDLYLPRPNPSDQSHENNERYDCYLKRAVFYPVLQQTSLALIGQCFIYDPDVKVPAELDVFVKNVDGCSDLVQFSRRLLSTNINFGRAGVLVDYPDVPSDLSLADSERIQPSMVLYQPDQIINWQEILIDGRKVCSRVVLKECHNSSDSFKEDLEDEWRELYLEKVDNGYYYAVNVWKKDKDKKFYTDASYKPMADGKRLDFIPFVFVGSSVNSCDICEPQMDSLACINLAHYVNSADYEDSSHMVGQPTPVFIGINEEWAEKVLKNNVRLGSRGCIPLPVGGDAKLLQAAPNSLPIEGMKHKEDQMVSLGAKLIQPSSVVRTATESTMDKSDESSILTCTSKNTSEAIEIALEWAYLFKTGKKAKDEAIEFKLKPESSLMNMTANERMQTVQDWQMGAITYGELRSTYKKAGIAYENIDSPPKLPVTVENNPAEGGSNMGTPNPSNGRNFIGNRQNE